MVSKCDICSICRRETFTYLHILCFLPPTISSTNITTISNICKFFQNHILTSRNIFSPFLHNLRCKHKMTDVRQKCNMYATTVFCASDGKIPIEMLCQRHRAPTRVYTTMQNIKWKYNCTIAIANLQLQTYWVPHSQPEIGGVWTLRTLALWMYGQCVHRNVKYEEYWIPLAQICTLRLRKLENWKYWQTKYFLKGGHLKWGFIDKLVWHFEKLHKFQFNQQGGGRGRFYRLFHPRILR